jgi:hypothetical protein
MIRSLYSAVSGARAAAVMPIVRDGARRLGVCCRLGLLDKSGLSQLFSEIRLVEKRNFIDQAPIFESDSVRCVLEWEGLFQFFEIW